MGKKNDELKQEERHARVSTLEVVDGWRVASDNTTRPDLFSVVSINTIDRG